MKKVLAIACLLVALTFMVAVAASAQVVQPDWRFYIKADDGQGSNAMSALQVGVAAGAKDGYGIDGTGSDSFDGGAAIPATNSTRGIVAVFGNNIYVRDIKSNRVPQDAAYNTGVTVGGGVTQPTGGKFGTYPWESNRKFWELRVFCLPSGELDENEQPLDPEGNIRLSFFTVAPDENPGSGAPMPVSMLPNAGGGFGPASYALRMVNNRGVEGAPANGTVWSIPIPTVHSATSPYFQLTLPMRALASPTALEARSKGYVMQFYQTPEPSSLMALGAGLMGLVGFASRRRRS